MARIINFFDGFSSDITPTAEGISAIDVAVTPSGNLTDTNVQAALETIYTGHIDLACDVHGLTGGACVVGTTQAQTLTNKKFGDDLLPLADATSKIGTGALRWGSIQATGTHILDGTLQTTGATTLFRTSFVGQENNIYILNSGQNDAAAIGAGIQVDRTGTAGSIAFDPALASDWKVGLLGSEVEIVTVSDTQTLSNKTLTDPLLNGGDFDVDAAGNVNLFASIGANNIFVGSASSTTVILGDLQVDGTRTFVNSTDMQVVDKNIIVNKGGNDASREGAGITVDGDNDGSLIFKDASGTKWAAGLVGSEVDLVGTTTTQTLTSKTLTSPTLNSPVLNGTISGTAFKDEDDMVSDSAIAVASQQSIKKFVDDSISAASTFIGLSDTPGTFAGQAGKLVQVNSGETALEFATPPAAAIPEGSIFPWVGGFFTNGSNAGYTFVLGSANTVAAANTFLNPLGFHVCDGAALNDSESTIFDGASRFLPNLTDERFLIGGTLVGSIGGTNTISDHTHSTPDHTHTDNLSFTVISHTHSVSSQSPGTNTAGDTTTDGPSTNTSSTPSNNNTNNSGGATTGGESSHTHSSSNLVTQWDADSNDLVWNVRSLGFSANTKKAVSGAVTVGTFSGRTNGIAIVGSTDAGTNHTHSTPNHTHTLNNHTHTLQSHTHTLSQHSHTVNSHNHSGATGSASPGTNKSGGITSSGASTTGSAGGSDNRPIFLSMFFIMKVKAA